MVADPIVIDDRASLAYLQGTLLFGSFVFKKSVLHRPLLTKESLMTPLPTTQGNGLSAAELFAGGTGITFDDVILLPPFTDSQAVGDGIRLDTDLARGFPLHLPIVSSPMDTVTEWQTAVHLALHGGLGFIHFNCPPVTAAEHVRRVKRFQMGIIYDPLCRPPDTPISEISRIKQDRGFSTILVTEDGTPKGKFLGMVTKGHVVLEPDQTRSLRDVMITRAELRVATPNDVRDTATARAFLRYHPAASKVPVLNEDGSVYALVTRDDVVKIGQYPHALLDDNQQLRVGAAVSTRTEDLRRIEALIDAGVDVLVIDSAQGGTPFAVTRLQEIKARKPELPVIAGNVVTPEQAEPLLEAGADALRVGMGSGSICTTQTVLRIGRAQLTAVHHVAQFADQRGIPVIADGGIRNSGDMLLALACGASTVMVGRLIAGCEETPGEETLDVEGRRRKRYRGMGSPSAIREGGRHRYGDESRTRLIVAQGIEADVQPQGSLDRFLPELAAALGKGMEYLGCATLLDLHRRVQEGAVRFELQSPAARQEGRPHDVFSLPSLGFRTPGGVL